MPATVTYDDDDQDGDHDPERRVDGGATYTARLDGAIAATDGVTLGSPTTWSSRSRRRSRRPRSRRRHPPPARLASPRTRAVTATFSRSMDPATVTTTRSRSHPRPAGQRLRRRSPTTTRRRRPRCTPTATARGIDRPTPPGSRPASRPDGTAPAAAVTWTFTTAACPCSLFSQVLVPRRLRLPTQDGRTGAGPFSYEIGVKVTVDQDRSSARSASTRAPARRARTSVGSGRRSGDAARRR